jgi:hypothetical protein
MSQSFDLLIDGMIETIRSRILPQLDDDFVRGQAFGIIYALNGLKLSADWSIAPLRDQIALQDKAFAEFVRLGAGLAHPDVPAGPRVLPSIPESADLERLRNDGDRKLGELLNWTSGAGADADAERARLIQSTLRHIIRDQLKVDISIMAESMFHELATGEESEPTRAGPDRG